MTTTKEVLLELTAWCERLRREGGTRLPSERALAGELKASRSTVRRALSVLADGGVITVARGRNGGAYLAGDTFSASTARRTRSSDRPNVMHTKDTTGISRSATRCRWH